MLRNHIAMEVQPIKCINNCNMKKQFVKEIFQHLNYPSNT